MGSQDLGDAEGQDFKASDKTDPNLSPPTFDDPVPPPVAKPSLSLPKPVSATAPPSVASLDEKPFAELADATARDADKSNLEAGGIWKTYKEVILAAIAGVLLVTAATLYSTSSSTPKPAPPAPSILPPPAVKPAPPPVATKRPEPAQPVEAAPVKPATPMLTIVSTPSGGLVEVNGVIYGKSPIIMPAPKGVASLEVVIKLDGHKKWRQQVSQSEAGHFAVTAKLDRKQ